MTTVDVDPEYRVVVTVVRDTWPARAYGDIQRRRDGRTIHFVAGEGWSRAQAVQRCIAAARAWIEDLRRNGPPRTNGSDSDSVPPTPSVV